MGEADESRSHVTVRSRQSTTRAADATVDRGWFHMTVIHTEQKRLRELLTITGSGHILSAALLKDGPDDMGGIRFDVTGRTDADDPSTEFHAVIDSLVDQDRTRRWKRLVDTKAEAKEVVRCHFSGFATIMAGHGQSAPRYHIRTFFIAPDISALTASAGRIDPSPAR